MCLIVAFPAAARDMRISVVVNEDAISMADVRDRMQLIIVSSGLPNTQDTRNRVMPQVIDSLIEEQIKLQDAARNNIDVSQEDVAAGLKTIADQNNFSLEQFEQIMRQQGVNQKTLEDQIRAQIAWTKVVREVIRPRVRVSPNDVEARLNRLKRSIGEEEYLTAEIFMPVEEASKDSEVRNLAAQLAREIQSGKAPFPAVAAQFSKAPGAAETGGMIGWVQKGQLEAPLEKKLVAMDTGEVSNPIKSTLGYHILLLREKRTISQETFPNEDVLMNQIGLERLDRAQRSRLLDLKSAAFIDRRDG